jgi:hypothetical protein
MTTWNTEHIMTVSRTFKIVLYWVVVLGYIITLFIVWDDLRTDMEEQQNVKKKNEMYRGNIE